MKGRIEQRGKNTWRLWVEVPRDPSTGKRQRETFTIKGTKRDAESKLTERLHSINSEGYFKPVNLTLGQYLREWLVYISPRVRPTTFQGYQHSCERHLISELGNIPLKQLQLIDI